MVDACGLCVHRPDVTRRTNHGLQQSPYPPVVARTVGSRVPVPGRREVDAVPWAAVLPRPSSFPHTTTGDPL